MSSAPYRKFSYELDSLAVTLYVCVLYGNWNNAVVHKDPHAN